jgi:hypothetical protein
MLTLKKICIEDRPWVSELMRMSGFRGSEYAFSNLYNWSKVYVVTIGRVEDFLIVRSANPGAVLFVSRGKRRRHRCA